MNRGTGNLQLAWLPLEFTWSCSLKPITSISVMLMSNPNCPAASSTQYNSVTLSWIMPETKAMSSAKSVLVKLISGCPLLLRC